MTKTEKCKQIRLTAESCEQRDIQSIFKDKLEIMMIEGGDNIVIYGAGNAGNMFVNSFLGVFGDRNAINCFLDKNAVDGQTCLGYNVYKPDDLRFDKDFRKKTLVLIGILLDDVQYDKVVESLKMIGYTKFANAMPFLIRLITYSLETSNENIIKNEIDSAQAALELMTDEHSEDTFLSLFNAHATVCYDIRKILSSNMTQYIDVKVPFRYNYRSFVDCGAFTGDTFEELVKKHNVEQYFGFEPDLLLYAKLSSKIKALHNKAPKSVILPLGVGERNEYFRFSQRGDGTSKISATGDNFLQIVSLDDMLKGYDDLFIKMDIEGAEISALKGAKNLIKNTAPDLGICVYHKISDLWHIPLLLKEWVPEYKFYMRSHNLYGFDTVLYATLGN